METTADLPFSLDMWIFRRIQVYNDKVAVVSISPEPVLSTWSMSTRRQKSRQVPFIFNVLDDAEDEASFSAFWPTTSTFDGHDTLNRIKPGDNGGHLKMLLN